MQPSKCVGCQNFPCDDVQHDCYVIPDIDVEPDDISIIMISEAAPENADDYYYAERNPLFEQTTVQAFNDAGANVSSMKDLINIGFYFTTAVKCGKKGYGIKTGTIKECSFLLEKELNLFPKWRGLMLMGDVAIKAINHIAKRLSDKRVIPLGSTYKLRTQKYYFQGKRVFPSYLQAGHSFFIEKSKRRMIGEDIAAALSLVEVKKNLTNKMR